MVMQNVNEELRASKKKNEELRQPSFLNLMEAIVFLHLEKKGYCGKEKENRRRRIYDTGLSRISSLKIFDKW